MSNRLRWEVIDNEQDAFSIHRAKIPGGWLVRLQDEHAKANEAMDTGITFVPDAAHRWDGKSLD
jgi:hypothetical protein